MDQLIIKTEVRWGLGRPWLMAPSYVVLGVLGGTWYLACGPKAFKNKCFEILVGGLLASEWVQISAASWASGVRFLGLWADFFSFVIRFASHDPTSPPNARKTSKENYKQIKTWNKKEGNSQRPKETAQKERKKESEEGRNKVSKKERTEERKEERKKGRKEERKKGKKGKRKKGRKEERKKERKEERKEGRKRRQRKRKKGRRDGMKTTKRQKQKNKKTKDAKRWRNAAGELQKCLKNQEHRSPRVEKSTEMGTGGASKRRQNTKLEKIRGSL